MAGLKNLCKLYGRMNVGGVLWLWDYANDQPRKASDMSAEEVKESERIKYEHLLDEIKRNGESK